MTPFAIRKEWLALLLSCFFVLSSPAPAGLQARQYWTGIWAHDFSTFGCKPIIFIYARETIAPGNLGFWVGPEISNRLKLYFGKENVATEGVDYLGLPDTNFFVGGAPPVGIGLMQILLTKAATQCPNAKIVAAGYSQGAAVTHRAIQYLSQYVKSRIIGVVTFGDTQTLQDGGRIIGFPLDKTLIICNVGDVVCTGTLYVFPIHLDYTKRVPEAVHWLIWKILSSYFNPPIKPWTGLGMRPGVGWWWPNATNATNATHEATAAMPSPTLFPDIPFGDVPDEDGDDDEGMGGMPTPTLVPEIPDELRSSLSSATSKATPQSKTAEPETSTDQTKTTEPLSTESIPITSARPKATEVVDIGKGCGALPQQALHKRSAWRFWELF